MACDLTSKKIKENKIVLDKLQLLEKPNVKHLTLIENLDSHQQHHQRLLTNAKNRKIQTVVFFTFINNQCVWSAKSWGQIDKLCSYKDLIQAKTLYTKFSFPPSRPPSYRAPHG